MYAYTCDSQSLQSAQHVWSRVPLQPFSDILTPFSYSVLAEISKHAWYRYYDRLGLTLPYAPPKIMRHHYGRPYLDIKWICQRDAEFAGLEPMVFEINGEPFALCTVAKSNFIGTFRNNLSQRRLEAQLQSLSTDMEAITAKARAWYQKVRRMRWTQAEILQIMEEIEPQGVDSLMAFYAARHNLERAYNALLQMSRATPATERIQWVNNTLSDLQGLVELDLTHTLLQLAAQARKDENVLAWLAGDEFGDWQSTCPDQEFSASLEALLDSYGHWATGEGELSNPRWSEQPRFLFKGILACPRGNVREPARIPSAAATAHLLQSIDSAQRKEAERHLAHIRSLSVLQSRALYAFAYILAGTRLWARAAGEEASHDERIRSADETFLFELEELKRMMTGEWNIANRDEIHATAEARRVKVDQWVRAQPGDLILDEVEAYPIHQGLPAVVGEAKGPLRRQKGLQPILCASAVVGTRQLDSGWTPTLPVAGGLLAAAGTPLDPIVAAARIWHVPTIVGLGPHYDRLVDGAQTRLDGGKGNVEQ